MAPTIRGLLRALESYGPPAYGACAGRVQRETAVSPSAERRVPEACMHARLPPHRDIASSPRRDYRHSPRPSAQAGLAALGEALEQFPRRARGRAGVIEGFAAALSDDPSCAAWWPSATTVQTPCSAPRSAFRRRFCRSRWSEGLGLGTRSPDQKGWDYRQSGKCSLNSPCSSRSASAWKAR